MSAENNDVVGKKLSDLTGRELLFLILLAFFGGNTSGGVLFSHSQAPQKEQLQRIERKLDQAQGEQEKLKESITELKHQVRELQIRSGLLWPTSPAKKNEKK